MLNKRGIEPVIAVVLLILITIIAAGIIIAFVIPFVKDNLSNSKECYDVLGKVSIGETAYNCAVSSGNNRTGFSIKVDSEKVQGIVVSLYAQGSSDAVDIEQNVNGSSLNPEIRMLGSAFGGILTVPEKGGLRTYVAKGIFERVEIAGILENGRKCEMADSIVINACNDPEAASGISQY